MDIEEFQKELLEAARNRLPGASENPEKLAESLLYEFVDRLTQAEEFTDVIPCHFMGVGSRGRRFRIDGYQQDEADGSLRLIVCDFSGEQRPESMTRTRAEASFKQVQVFIEDSVASRIWSEAGAGESDAAELASLLSSTVESITRYRIYLITDSIISGRIRDLPESELGGVPIEYHIWDVSRLAAVSSSLLGLEELEIDLTEFVSEGLPCLAASRTDEYEGYLAVISGDVLAKLYDQYGSRLLEGNVRSYLTARGKINKSIQGTIRAEPEKFFVYNNGITCTATKAYVEHRDGVCRLLSVRYLQIVNGGQTTASLHNAFRLGNADLKNIHVQMKLSVVTVNESVKLEDMIERIARYSNSQNKISEADFFSNHPYHQAIERLSRRIPAPAANGAQYHTYWFYERARGQYQNAQLHLTPAKRREFLRVNPRTQMLVKTDVAKYENSWMRKPHVVSQGAQKNFSNFASFVTDKWGQDGKHFNNEDYFREIVARSILFRSVEKLVSSASWYQTGLPRAQIVTYTIAKLSDLINQYEEGATLDFRVIWNAQKLPVELDELLQRIAEKVCRVITVPPVAGMHVGEWSKKEKCWHQVGDIEISFPINVKKFLLSSEEARFRNKEKIEEGSENNKIDAMAAVVKLGNAYWLQLASWSAEHSPIYGKESDLVRLASRPGWVPTDRQASVLLGIMGRLEAEGFRAR